MSFSTATTWALSFALTFAWPSQLDAMTSTGAFCWYSAWCFIGAIIVYFFVPETRGKSLEELDLVFSIPIRVHGANKFHQLRYWLRLSSDPPENLEDIIQENHAARLATRNVYSEGKRAVDFKEIHEIEHASSPDAV